jgi:predicted RNA methylase
LSTATRPVPDIVIDVLNRSTTVDNRLDLPEQLDRKEYDAIKKVINAVGGKWNRSAGTHLWPAGVDVATVIEPVLLTGKVTDERKLYDAFYTPADIAKQVIDAAEIWPGQLVLEPSAGMGALALPAAHAGAEVVAYELRPLTWVEHGLSPLKINDDVTAEAGHIGGGDGHITLHTGVDFLTVDRDPVYDRVVMNPPFSNQADMRHVRHAARFVTPGGRLVAIMSPSFMFRTTKVASDFRDWLDEHPHDITALPDGAFKPAGTGVRTDLLTVDL